MSKSVEIQYIIWCSSFKDALIAPNSGVLSHRRWQASKVTKKLTLQHNLIGKVAHSSFDKSLRNGVGFFHSH